MTHKISWLNRPGTKGETWNVMSGCTPISAGCLNCYAQKMAKRLQYLGSCLLFDEVWLDHDLGGEEHVDSGRDDTGMAVVRWIVANKPLIGEVIVHSLNHDAARSMHDDLEAAGYSCSLIPFTAVICWKAIP